MPNDNTPFESPTEHGLHDYPSEDSLLKVIMFRSILVFLWNSLMAWVLGLLPHSNIPPTKENPEQSSQYPDAGK
jgi:hypothetical protein